MALPKVTQHEHAEHGAIKRAEVRDANNPRSPAKVETYAYWNSGDVHVNGPVMTVVTCGCDIWIIDKEAWGQLAAMAKEVGLDD